MALMTGHRGLVLGVANERSLAYGIARAVREHGAELALTYQNERLRGRVEELGQALGAALVAPCDLTSDAEISALVAAVEERFGALDFLVHAVAFANRDELGGSFLSTTREGFRVALDVSVYSLVAAARAFAPLLQKSTHAPSILTLSYYGARKAVPNYNVMGVAKAALESTVRYLAADLGPQGIRVNALSPGPIRTLSAAGIRGLRDMLDQVQAVAPLRRNVTIEDVGNMSVPLLCALGAGVTGEVVHVDAGYHALGALAARAPSPPAPRGG